MRERPILFSSPMVRAILDGRKTKTRRVVKVQTGDLFDIGACVAAVQEYVPAIDPIAGMVGRASRLIRCPYGVPGDLLWVREACRAEELSRPQRERPATRKEREAWGWTRVVEVDELDGCDGVRYLADDHWRIIKNTPAAGEAWSDLYHYRGRGKGGIGNTVPPIHMPRWASRITLRVTDVRVEQLNDCSEADAIAEGLSWVAPGVWSVAPSLPIVGDDPRDVYRQLWEHINGAGSWAANPWVWVVTFERVTP